MKRLRRIPLSPGTLIGLMALFFALGGSALALGEHVQGPSVAQQRCANGAVRGIAVVTGIPSQGIANLPGSFTGAGKYFGRKFEVRFVGIAGASAVASATGDASANVEPIPGNVFRVVMHPAGRDDKLDLPFTVVVV